MKKQLTKALALFMIAAMIFTSMGMFAATSVYGYTYIANGIDVSAWQGVINWTNVKASGVDFAILRIMASGKDSYFEANYTNGHAAGVKLGVYCYSYAATVEAARAEANKVLSWLGGRKLEYPIYYDIEDAKQSALTKAQRTELCIAFCDVIQAAGYRAGIYSGTYWFNNYLDRATLTAKYEIWEAMWPASNGVQINSPIYDKSSTCGMWQYSSVGSVSGISGRVDMNVSYKDYAAYMIANGYNGYGDGTGTVTLTGYYQTTGSVNYRTGPSTSYDVIATLPAGTIVTVVGFDSTENWALVCYGGYAGYVSRSYLGYIRSFAYSLNYLTNNANTMAAQTVKPGDKITVPTPAADPDGKAFKGWQLLRYTDFVWHTGSTWDANQKNAKLYQPGEVITLDESMFNPGAGDDYFYLAAVWNRPVSETVIPVTPTNTTPEKYGWQWPKAEAYGYIGNYGGNGQDIELSVDLCLLPAEEASVAAFYTDGTTKTMQISQTSVTVGTKTVDYDWGALGLDNWHNVKFKIYNGSGYVFIDGALVAYEEGITANETYQLLFSLRGEMAIDNLIMMSSDGTTFFDCDFEDEKVASTLMGEGLGHRTLLFPDTSDFEVVVSPVESEINGTGGITLTASPTAGEEHTYSWSCSDSTLAKYMTENGNTCTIDVNKDLGKDIMTYVTCTVTSNGNVTQSARVTVNYTSSPAPVINSISPETSSVVGTGSSTYSVSAEGEGITYSWTSSNAALNDYMSGKNTANMTITIPSDLGASFSTTITCTVTASNGKTAERSAQFSYITAPVPNVSKITPDTATVTGTGSATYKVSAEGEDLTYSWTSSNAFLNDFMTGTNTPELSVTIPEDLGVSFNATFTCTVTNSYGKTASEKALFEYKTSPVTAPDAPVITPETASVTDTGTVKITVANIQDGLTYKWTSDNERLNAYLHGVDTATLTVNIADILEDSFTATVTCTVTNSYGMTASTDVEFEYIAEFDGGSVVVIQGDIDGDGVVNAKDTNMVRRIVCGVVTADENQVAAGDVNGDGKINGMDANILTRYAAGVIEEF